MPIDQHVGKMGVPRLGYHRAQTCRPFLPELFPDYNVLGWIDSDTWFQDPTFLQILAESAARTQHIHIAPELHYSYPKCDKLVDEEQRSVYFYYAYLYGEKKALDLCRLPILNSGFFALHRESPLWVAWQEQIHSIYIDRFEEINVGTRHFGEQLSLNMLIRSDFPAIYFDPLFNYLCLWELPVRDVQGTVRLGSPPFTPIGMLHLAGGWRHFGEKYLRAGLLYRQGEYLSPKERQCLEENLGGSAVR